MAVVVCSGPIFQGAGRMGSGSSLAKGLIDSGGGRRPHPTPRRADRYYGTSPIGAQRLCIYLFSEQVCDCINENSASQRAAKRKYGGPNPGCGRPGVRKEKKFGIFYLPLDKEN